MISQMIAKSNIFDKINDHMSIDMAKQVLELKKSNEDIPGVAVGSPSSTNSQQHYRICGNCQQPASW